jgi:ADP-ribose pyrophosphatase YjhB (NUDIX family)
LNTQTYDPAIFPPRIPICVGAVVLKKDKVLFVRQTYGDLKGRWSIPWGLVDGRKSDGSLEPPDTAAIRETQEESGVIAEIEGLLGLQNHCDKQGNLWLYLLYLCRHVSGEPTPDNHETDQAAYFSLDEMDAFTESFDEFCEWITRRVLQREHHIICPEPTNPYQPHLAFL